jgi:hypothetical protein
MIDDLTHAFRLRHERIKIQLLVEPRLKAAQLLGRAESGQAFLNPGPQLVRIDRLADISIGAGFDQLAGFGRVIDIEDKQKGSLGPILAPFFHERETAGRAQAEGADDNSDIARGLSKSLFRIFGHEDVAVLRARKLPQGALICRTSGDN